MISNSVFVRIPCESVPFHYMDHAEIRARAQKRRLERMGVTLTTKPRGEGNDSRNKAEGSGFTHRNFMLPEVVPITRPAGAQPYNLGWVREL